MTLAEFERRGKDPKNIKELKAMAAGDETFSDIYTECIRRGFNNSMLMTICIHCYRMGINKAIGDMLLDTVNG